MIENYLCDIGLNKNEAKVYMELMQIGPQPASIISNRVGINRSSLYSVLDLLLRKGLVSYMDNKKVRVFSANDPSSLVAFIDKECKKYSFYRNQTLSLIPKIRDIQSVYNVKKSKYQIFDGLDSLKLNFSKLSADSESLTVFFPFNSESFLFSLFLSILKNIKVNIRFVLPNVFRSQVNALKIPNESVFYESEQISLGVSQLIVLLDDKLCFLNFEKNYESLLLIEEKGYYALLKSLIDFNCVNFGKNVT